MYSPQFIEMYSTNLHAERVAGVERKRLAYAVVGEASSAQAPFARGLFSCLPVLAARLRRVGSKTVKVRSSAGGSTC